MGERTEGVAYLLWRQFTGGNSQKREYPAITVKKKRGFGKGERTEEADFYVAFSENGPWLDYKNSFRSGQGNSF